jgi:hypothetical protein
MLELTLERDGKATSLHCQVISARAVGDPVIIRTIQGYALTEEQLTSRAREHKLTMGANAYIQGDSLREYAGHSAPSVLHAVQFYQVETA